jgi:hypothetical protein
MARTESRIIRWAGVEFQPNLKKPGKPVRLGIVLTEATATSVASCVVGRMPLPGSRPPEFQQTGAVTIEIASKWVDNIAKDVGDTDLDGDSLFERIARRWRFNLYLRNTKTVRLKDDRRSLETIAKEIYEQFVGVPFKDKPTPKRRPTTRIPALPPAWQLERFKRERLSRQTA